MMLKILFVMNVVFGSPVEQHKKEIAAFDQQLQHKEHELRLLENKKINSRQGKEMEETLNEIAQMHRSLLEIRRERTQLKEHLRRQHANDDILYDPRLYKDKLPVSTKESTDPLDKKLDELQSLMQQQYARYSLALKQSMETSSAEEKAFQEKNRIMTLDQQISAHKNSQGPSPEESTPSQRERYMNKAISTELKVRKDFKPKESSHGNGPAVTKSASDHQEAHDKKKESPVEKPHGDSHGVQEKSHKAQETSEKSHH